MFQFFSKTTPLQDFSSLGADMHAHIIPGIDDGAPDLETAIELVNALQTLGYRRIYSTPHIMSDMYPNTRDSILRQRDLLRESLEELAIPVYIDAAAEYFIDEDFVKKIHTEPLLCLPGHRVLVEMSTIQPYPDLHRVLFDLQMKGYQPVMAHPERYPYYHSGEGYERLKNMGCQLQLNLLSMEGYYGNAIQNAAKRLLKAGWIDWLGTDLHHARHAERLRKALAAPLVVQTLGKYRFLNSQLLDES